MSGLAHASYGNPSDDADEVYTEAEHFGGEFGQQLKLPFSCSKFVVEPIGDGLATNLERPGASGCLSNKQS
jgi:hypothetical protein